MTKNPPRILSLGAGVQSSTILMMATEGVERVDGAIFADTGWEPEAVYAHLERLKERAARAGIPLITVSGGNLAEDEASTIRHVGSKGKYTLMPLYTLRDGKKGRMRRVCTSRYKIEPIHAYLQGKGVSESNPIKMLLGISWDESERMADSRVPWAKNVYPLVERRMTRADCLRWMAEHNYPAPPKSACITCPFGRDARWRNLRDTAPEDFQRAISFDDLIRTHYTSFDGVPYLHESRQPLRDIDFGPAQPGDDESGVDGCGLLCAAEKVLS